MKSKTLKRTLNIHFLLIILFAFTVASVFIIAFNFNNNLQNEEQAMNESLTQAQSNIQTRMTMVDDYLTSIISNPVIQTNLTNNPITQAEINANIDGLNNVLFSTDIFKKSLDSVQLFASDTNNIYSPFSNNYSNAIFSFYGMEDYAWFQNTKDLNGRTYWSIDDSQPNKYSVCASRLIPDCTNLSKVLGILRANISLEKYMEPLNNLSFGDKSYACLSVSKSFYESSNKISDSLKLNDLKDNTSDYLKVGLPIASTDWHIIALISNKKLQQGAITNLILIFLIFLVTAGIASLLCIRFSKTVSRPIEILCRQMSGIDKATLSGESVCSEIQQLFQIYNRMLDEMAMLTTVKEEITKKLKQAELSALQAQINPHFIYNTLESVNSLIFTNQNSAALHVVSSLGVFLRNSLCINENYILLEKEIEQVISYFDIQQLRYSNRIKLELQLPSPIPKYRIIKFILQPLVENCIIHGFAGIDYTGVIRIHVYEDTKWCFLEVEDNGIGSDVGYLNSIVENRYMRKNVTDKFYSIQNIQQRIQNGFGDQSRLYYEENETGAVTARIQIDKSFLKKEEEDV